MTSVNQWTLKYILVNPVRRMIRVVIIVAEILCFLFMNRYAIRPKNTTAIVAWPLGIAKFVSVINAFRGRALWKISFESLIKIPVIRIVAAKRIPCFFEILK